MFENCMRRAKEDCDEVFFRVWNWCRGMNEHGHVLLSFAYDLKDAVHLSPKMDYSDPVC